MRITRIITSSIVKGLRVLKHSPFRGVTRTNELLSPFGFDSNPYPGIKGAIQSATTKGRGVILGIFNKFIKADYGESRTFSTDAEGNEIKTEFHQKNDGSISLKAALAGGSPLFEIIIDPTGNIVVDSPLAILNGNLTINGNLVVIGSIGAGTLAVTGALTVGGKDFTTHTHPYDDSGTPKVTGPVS